MSIIVGETVINIKIFKYKQLTSFTLKKIKYILIPEFKFSGIYRNGDDAIPGPERYGGTYREVRTSLHTICALQQRERATVQGVQ